MGPPAGSLWEHAASPKAKAHSRMAAPSAAVACFAMNRLIAIGAGDSLGGGSGDLASYWIGLLRGAAGAGFGGMRVYADAGRSSRGGGGCGGVAPGRPASAYTDRKSTRLN